jgi:hypothetical protein
MALIQNPKVNTTGLFFAYDTADIKNSFLGEPTTNLIGTYNSNVANAYPSIGNNWQTYNTNQYNNNTYFSIGTISSVTNNIVTTSGNHPLRSFDVVTPQTTGGGVTAGTNYVVKKISNTTFSLHSYNSSEDGSQGYWNTSTGYYKVYDSYMNDTRISINSTSFPTMWWGPPHLPNSGIVKEIVTNGFNYKGVVHDCMVLHWHRPDGVVDGMAYGVFPSYSANTQYTFSCYVRSKKPNAQMHFDMYFSGTATGQYGYLSPILTNEWKKWTQTFTSTGTPGVIYFYFWPDVSAPVDIEIAELQCEQKDHATPFILTTRSVTNSIKDITTRYTPDVTNVSFDSSARMYFDGTNDYISTGITSLPSSSVLTIDVWTKPTSTTQTKTLVSKWGSGSQSNFCFLLFLNWFASGNLYFLVGNSAGTSYSTHSIAHNLSTSSYINYTVTYNNGTVKMYRNGAIQLTENSANTSLRSVSTGLTIGADFDGGNPDTLTRSYAGDIPVVKLYSRVLTDSEVYQNYIMLKSRFCL